MCARIFEGGVQRSRLRDFLTGLVWEPTVRILKNLRGRLVDEGMIASDTAPSYYLEGLLYKVPNDRFGRSYADTIADSINWILNADRRKFVGANEQYYLLWENGRLAWRDEK